MTECILWYSRLLEPHHEDQSNYKISLHSKISGESPNKTVNRNKVGLNNLGNTCYLNSVLQALYNTKLFRNKIMTYDKDMKPSFSKLQKLFTFMQFSQKYTLSPTDVLKSRPPWFSPRQQQDSCEFLEFLLNTLDEQEKALDGPSRSIARNIFGGRTITASRCTICGTQNERCDDFFDLSLSFPSNLRSCWSVKKLLKYYLKAETLCNKNRYSCDICGGLRDGERITSIVEAPKRLIITLKNFRYDPEAEQLTKFLTTVKLNKSIKVDDYGYKLYAVIFHKGTRLDSGHYYTFARDKTGWYKFNDASVTHVTESDLRNWQPSETPYILFYRRKDVKEPKCLRSTKLSYQLRQTLLRDKVKSTKKRSKVEKSYKKNSNKWL